MAELLTRDNIIQQFRNIHGDQYDYSKVEYLGNRNNIIIICKQHGEFLQTPKSHKTGRGCNKCAIKETTKKITLSKEALIQQFKEIHGNTYDYSKVEYVNTKIDVIIICKQHGEFLQKPCNHKSGYGCIKCVKEQIVSSVYDNAIQQFKEIHGNVYDYSKVKYINSNTNVTIICPIHGEFLQSPSSHKTGAGCNTCSTIRATKMKILTNDEAIQQFTAIHGNTYDYSKVKYVDSNTAVIIICKKHGEFLQKPCNHKTGNGCRQCGTELVVEKNKCKKDEVIQQFKDVHFDKYDYSKVNYINSVTKVVITCPIHGDFQQSPRIHKKGSDCPQCSAIAGAKSAGITRKSKNIPSPKRITAEQFIICSQKIHDNKYDYSKVNYNGITEEVIIICPNHGEFLQKPYNHKRGRGCQRCGIGNNRNQMQTKWLNSLQKEIIHEYRIPENKLRPVDGYDPSTNTIYQFHGDFFHGNPVVFDPNDTNTLLKKTYGELYQKTLRLDDELRSYGYNLIIMWEHDWKKIESLFLLI